jgi:long-chain acyl-CoA synthetase
MKIYITGINGFIGSQLAYSLLRSHPETKVIGIYHASDQKLAEAKHQKLLEHWHKFLPPIDGSNFTCIAWSEFEPGPADHEGFVVINAAASTNFDDPIEFARTANLATTLELLNKVRVSGKIARFVHISTAFVSACHKGEVNEEQVPLGFNNTYEQTKYESELAVMHSGLPYTIFRPSIVIGDSLTGYSKHFRVFYSMFRLWLTGVIPRAPIDQQARADVVPIDHVVDAILRFMDSPRTLSRTINITSGLSSPSVREIFEAGLRVFNEKPARFSSPVMLKILSHPLVTPLLNHSLAEVLRTLSGHFPYFGSRHRVFSTKLFDSLNGENLQRKKFSEYGPGIFSYALSTKWGKISGQLGSKL